MKEEFLVVDNDFAKSNGIDSYVSIFPSIGYEPKWSLPFKEHTRQHKSIVSLKNKLTEHFAKNVYSPSLGYSAFACERLFLNYGSLIIFVLSDRLLRLNKLAGLKDLNQLKLPEVQFEFNPEWTFGHFYYKKVEKDPLYNQWIVNSILRDLETIDVLKYKAIVTEEYGTFYSNRQGILKRITRNLRNGTLLVKLNKLVSNIYPAVILFLSRIFNRIPIDAKNVTFISFSKKLHRFFWPFGPLAPLESIAFKVYPPKLNTKIKREDFLEHKDFVADAFKDFLMNTQGEINLPDSSFFTLIELITEQLPTFTTEQSEVYCEKYLNEFKQYKGSFFLADGVGGNTLKSLRLFACRELSIPVVATQHSGWGGYLANGALVNEMLIDGADHYITFGWDNKTHGESMWIKDAIKLPSPLLSELISLPRERFRHTENRSLLLSLGFIYRFPAFYNSFLRLDIINDYIRLLESIMEDLSKAGWHLTISFYNNEVANYFSEKSQYWTQSDVFNVTILDDHNIRLRDYMQNKDFDSIYDAIIWDIPAGGFSESISLGKKSFALLNENLINTTLESQPFLNDLYKYGIFFRDGSDLTHSLNEFSNARDWYLNEDRQKALNNFFYKFLRSNHKWEEEWVNFLSSKIQ